MHEAWANYIKWQFSGWGSFLLSSSRFSSSLSPAPSLSSVNVQVCGFVEWHSVFQVKLVAQLLTWLVNGCYLWEGGVDAANIAHSPSTSLPLFPFLSLPSPSPLLMVMAVMTEETKKRHRSENTEMEKFRRETGRKKDIEDEKCREAGKGRKKGCWRSSGSFIKTIIVQDLRIPPGAGVHVEAHIIN